MHDPENLTSSNESLLGSVFMEPDLREYQGLRIAVAGCGHGTLRAIYAATRNACTARQWSAVDLLVIGGDFQAVRNAHDLSVMSCPVKYREMGDFHDYYSGEAKAPYLTIFVGGNHEASSHMWELYYGGWVAPSIYYLGASNVIWLGPVRIAGMSGIWKGYNYNKPHFERLPYNQDDIKSIYHTRELDIRKLLQIRTQVDVVISHDWPRAIERHGDSRHLFRMKPDFEQESRDGTLGNQAAAYVMDRLRPLYWFAAHMHCKFAAMKTYTAADSISGKDAGQSGREARPFAAPTSSTGTHMQNHDEIDLDLEDDAGAELTSTNHHAKVRLESAVPAELRALLPSSFSSPAVSTHQMPQRLHPPPAISNTTVRFLALDKCLPGRQFLQLLEVPSVSLQSPSPSTPFASPPRFRLYYDPEWLAITKAFAHDLVLGRRDAKVAADQGEDRYLPNILSAREWINRHVVRENKLEIPENFQLTAPRHTAGMPDKVDTGPDEYNNPQTQAFCDLIGIENQFSSSDEEKRARFAAYSSAVVPEKVHHVRDDARGRGRGGRQSRGNNRHHRGRRHQGRHP